MNHMLTPSYELINVECLTKAYCYYCYTMYVYFAMNLLFDLHQYCRQGYRSLTGFYSVGSVNCELFMFLIINKVALM